PPFSSVSALGQRKRRARYENSIFLSFAALLANIKTTRQVGKAHAQPRTKYPWRTNRVCPVHWRPLPSDRTGRPVAWQRAYIHQSRISVRARHAGCVGQTRPGVYSREPSGQPQLTEHVSCEAGHTSRVARIPVN